MPNNGTYDTKKQNIKTQLWQAKPSTGYARHDISYALAAGGPRRSDYGLVMETELVSNTDSLEAQLDRKFQDPAVKSSKPIGQSDVLVLHAGTPREAAYYLTRSVWKRVAFN